MSTENAAIEIGRAELADQGKLGPLLLEVYGPVLQPENQAAAAALLPVSSLEEELMAADDFYFSVIELMDCCFLARLADGALVGAACVNPYINELHYVAVLPAWRRRGIGKKLAELALAELTRRGSDHVRVEASLELADAGGLAFAESLGFRPVRRSVMLARKL